MSNASEVPAEKKKQKNQKEEYSLCHIVLPIFTKGVWVNLDPTPSLTYNTFYTTHGHTYGFGVFLRRLAFALHGL